MKYLHTVTTVHTIYLKDCSSADEVQTAVLMVQAWATKHDVAIVVVEPDEEDGAATIRAAEKTQELDSRIFFEGDADE